MTKAATLGRDLLARPGEAVERLRGTEGLRPALWIYVAYLAVSTAFHTLKPPDFPSLPAGAPALEVEGGALFWARVHAYNPLFTAAGIALIGWFAGLLRGGRLPLRLGAAALCGTLPALLVVARTQDGVSLPAFAGGWVLLAGAAVWAGRRMDLPPWRPLSALILAVNVVALALMPALGLAAGLRAPAAYHILELAMVFWTLGLAAFGVSRLGDLSAARAFCAIFAATVCQVFLIFSLHLLGIIPRDALKALMTV